MVRQRLQLDLRSGHVTMIDFDIAGVHYGSRWTAKSYFQKLLMLVIIEIFIYKIGPSFSEVLDDSSYYQAAEPGARLERGSCSDSLALLEEHLPFLPVVSVDQILNCQVSLISSVIKLNIPLDCLEILRSSSLTSCLYCCFRRVAIQGCSAESVLVGWPKAAA